MAIQLIESISYSPIHSIIGYEREPGNKVKVIVESWTILPMTVASGEMKYDQKEVDASIHYSIEIQARLSKAISILPESIFKVRLCSGKELIIGSPFLPVRAIISNNLSISKFELSYSNIYEPSELIP